MYKTQEQDWKYDWKSNCVLDELGIKFDQNQRETMHGEQGFQEHYQLWVAWVSIHSKQTDALYCLP